MDFRDQVNVSDFEDAMRRLGWLSTYARQVLLCRHLLRSFETIAHPDDVLLSVSRDFALNLFRVIVTVLSGANLETKKFSSRYEPPDRPETHGLAHSRANLIFETSIASGMPEISFFPDSSLRFGFENSTELADEDVIFVNEINEVAKGVSISSKHIGDEQARNLLNKELWRGLTSNGPSQALSFFENWHEWAGEAGAFWRKWFIGFVNGDPIDWQLQKQVALIPDIVWEAGPEAVAEAIKKIEFQFRTAIAPRLIRDKVANLFRVENDADIPPDVEEFATHRARQALNATLASVSDNIFNAGSYEAIVISETLEGPKTLSLLALGLYDACLGLNANIGDRYPDDVALINLMNALAGIVDELCELDDDAKQRCARRAGYVVSPVGDALTVEELKSIPQLTAPELELAARKIVESDVERILANEAAMPRWRRIRLANWMTTISIYWDGTKKGFKEAETLAKMVTKLRSAWRSLDGGGD